MHGLHMWKLNKWLQFFVCMYRFGVGTPTALLEANVESGELLGADPGHLFMLEIPHICLRERIEHPVIESLLVSGLIIRD